MGSRLQTILGCRDDLRPGQPDHGPRFASNGCSSTSGHPCRNGLAERDRSRPLSPIWSPRRPMGRSVLASLDTCCSQCQHGSGRLPRASRRAGARPGHACRLCRAVRPGLKGSRRSHRGPVIHPEPCRPYPPSPSKRSDGECRVRCNHDWSWIGGHARSASERADRLSCGRSVLFRCCRPDWRDSRG